MVARRLAEHGAIHVDADALAREVVEPGTPGLAAIAERFGPSVIASDGSLDRAALGGIIFTDSEARLALNEITHPAVWRRAKELFDEATEVDPDAVIVYDVPLLVEASGSRPITFDVIAVVTASVQTRMERLVELRGMNVAEAAGRLASQATDEERLAIADVVIDSNGTLDETLDQADSLWAKVTA